jgi:hypothetical protein
MNLIAQKIKAMAGFTNESLGAVDAQLERFQHCVHFGDGPAQLPPGLGQDDVVVHVAHIRHHRARALTLSHNSIEGRQIQGAEPR